MDLLLGALPCGSSPLACHALSKLIYELGSKSLQIQLSIYWEVTKTWKGLTSLNEKCSKVNMPFFPGQWLRRVRHAETDKEEKKETKAIRPCEKSWNREPFLAIVCEFQKRAKTQKERASAGGAVRKIERNTVRVWESEKEKGDIFLCSHKEDKLVEFSWSFWVLQPWRVGVFEGRFCYWFCGEIVFTPWD